MANVRKLVRRIILLIFRKSELDTVIPPEIIDDAFSRAIRQIVAEPAIRTVLEIGSSDGSGSTASLVAAMEEKELKNLYCLEISEPRFQRLSERYAHLSWVHCYNLPSVPLDRMPTSVDVANFYATHRTSPLHRSGLSAVQRWLRQDIEYIERGRFTETGIEAARRDAGVDVFDLVLIDGSEFTGEAELAELYGARYILLDDILTFKNLTNVQRLSADPNYKLLAEDPSCRNGFAAFMLR